MNRTATFKLVDSHAHLDEVDDPASAVDRSREAGLSAIIAVGTGYDSNCRVLELAAKYESFVFPALGMHPQELGDYDQIRRNLGFIEENIEGAVAIGEIGLDYHKKVVSRAGKDMQKAVLKDVLEVAGRFRKPVSVHSRYSWKDCFLCVRESKIEQAVFHWYTGPVNVLRDILNEGYFASATLAAEYHDEHRRTIRETPVDRLMLETDTPVVYRWGTEFAHQAEPADVATRVLDAVASIKGIDPTIVADNTTANALRFFRIQSSG
ncbi:MAG: TatD family hydrolase [Dehalococcoidia bacterium]